MDTTAINRLFNQVITKSKSSVDSLRDSRQEKRSKTSDDGTEYVRDIQAKIIDMSMAAPLSDWKLKIDSVRCNLNTKSSFKSNNPDEMLFYLLDVVENKSEKMLHLFGRAWDDNNSTFTSVCINVSGLYRYLYVVPRQNTSEDDRSEDIMKMVGKEMMGIRKVNNISEWKSKIVKRKYCFYNPDIPKGESSFMKIKYPFEFPSLRHGVEGKTFSYVMGKNTSMLEHFLIKRKIRGPCWLSVKNSYKPKTKLSWCTNEVSVRGQNNISVYETVREPPPVSTLSIKVLTRKKKVWMISLINYPIMSIDRISLSPDDAYRVLTLSTTIPGVPIFTDSIRNGPGNFALCPNERALLSCFYANMHNLDIDIITGYDIHEALSLLDERAKVYSLKTRSKLGRLRGMKFTSCRNLVPGRLLCDIHRNAKELKVGGTYTFTDLCKTQLNLRRESIDPILVNSTDDYKIAVKGNENDAYMAFCLLHKLRIIPLTLQLSQIAGNLWNRTLQIARSNRVEYLLLHELHDNKYLTPDKQSTSSTNIEIGVKKKGPAFCGGRVLDPAKGLYSGIVLLLDFNSLYPSIIQEYGICFTTNVSENGDMVNPQHKSDILPMIMRRLLKTRNAVKSRMKMESSQYKKRQLDIKQLGLKLTANTIYGCLGSPYSRFYSVHLAKLITLKGRESLAAAVECAKGELGLDVIYGDTDSIMVHTAVHDLDDALVIGNTLKKEVNKRYTELEIEIDGVYKKLLLIKKKKYAGIAIDIKQMDDNERVIIERIELKGLDMVRSDWCNLSKKICSNVLSRIFCMTVDTPKNVYAYLKNVNRDIKAGLYDFSDFVLRKQLTKPLSEYKDPHSHVHVCVAMRLVNEGVKIAKGDAIEYLICEQARDETGILSSRSYTVNEFNKSDILSLDLDWYVAHQILPPIKRLCEQVYGISAELIKM